MKILKAEFRQIVKEELTRILTENTAHYSGTDDDDEYDVYIRVQYDDQGGVKVEWSIDTRRPLNRYDGDRKIGNVEIASGEEENLELTGLRNALEQAEEAGEDKLEQAIDRAIEKFDRAEKFYY